jgi:hypothetical protein
MGRHGAARSSAWIWLFSSKHRTGAFSGGAMYKPATSRTLAGELRAAGSFQVPTVRGLRPKARQIRDTADWDMPADLAIDRAGQCVPLFGGASPKALEMTRSTCSPVMVRGRPGRPEAY